MERRGKRGMKDRFEVVGIQQMPCIEAPKKEKWYRGRPVFAAVLLGLIVAGCLACSLFVTKDPAYLDLRNCNVPPCREFLFGTDSLGRDIFSMIWYGGRISLFIGITSAVFSMVIAIVVGAVSASAPAWADALLMRLTEILFSVPGLLLVILMQAALGEASVLSISFVIGITGWTAMAKVVRTEVLQLRSSGYVIASKCMGGSFFHILWQHLVPGFLPSVMFMAVMNIRSAMITEATLSFMGIGLPVEVISWGSMLSLAEGAVFTNFWWMLLFPGAFLVVTLLCITRIGDALCRNERNNIS